MRNSRIDRNRATFPRLSSPVISIGNLTSGGTGKTPLTLYIARRLSNRGYRVAIVSRGYRGSREKSGGVVHDGNRLLMTPTQAGDEPFMMALELKTVPVLVGRDRFKSAQRAITDFGATVIVLDDGFQHRKLKRDIDLLLVDHCRGFGNGHLLPRGPLREPLSSLSRAHAVIETRAARAAPSNYRQTLLRHGMEGPVFQCEFRPSVIRILGEATPTSPYQAPGAPPPTKALRGLRVYAFSGLADNDNFHQTLSALGCQVVGFRHFPDHYWYQATDVTRLQKEALQTQAQVIATTEKDIIRMDKDTAWPLKVVIFGINPDFGNQEDAFHQFLITQLIHHEG